MHYWWKVRLLNSNDNYWSAQIKTSQDLKEIDAIQDFYFALTGCKLYLEGMSIFPYENVSDLQTAFFGLWQRKIGSAYE